MSRSVSVLFLGFVLALAAIVAPLPEGGRQLARAAVTTATASFELTNPVIESGSLLSGSGTSLTHNDQVYYAVNSTATSPYKAAWSASTMLHVPGTAVTRLTLTFDSKYSGATNDQHISLWNYLTGNWEVVIQAPTTTTDTVRSWSTTDGFTIRKFISPKGKVQVRVYNSAATSFTRFSDWLNVTIDYTPQAANNAYSPVGATVEYGTLQGGSVASLGADDGTYYSLRSTTVSPYRAAWQASFAIAESPGNVSALTLTYDGKFSGTTNDQYLSLWNFPAAKWEVVRQAPSTTADATIRWTSVDAGAISKYISASGEVRARLYNSATATFTRDSDYLNLYVESSPVGTFTFAQYTDVHSPESGTHTNLATVINDLNSLNPAFAINTGDTASYAKAAEFDTYLAQIAGLTVPRYETAGNHDVRWFAPNGKGDFQNKLGAPYHFFSHSGVYFVVFDSSVFMENEGAVDPATLAQIQSDLSGVGPDAPVFVLAHHPNVDLPLRQQLIDLLQGYNVKAFMGGHDHVWQYWTENGMIWEITDDVKAAPVYALVTVTPTHIKIAKRNAGTATTTAWITVPTARQAGTRLTVTSATADSVTGSVTVQATVTELSAPITAVEARIDGTGYGSWQTLSEVSPGVFEGTVTIAGYVPQLVRGQHFVEVRATDGDGFTWKATRPYTWTHSQVSTLWEFPTGGAIQAPPTYSEGTLFAGSGDGKLYAIDAVTGAQQWAFATGGAVVSSPAVWGTGADRFVIFGSGDGRLYALNATTGAQVWTHTTGGAILSNPLVDGGTVYFGAGDQKIYALDAATGAFRWSYHTEGLMRQRPLVSGGVLYAVVRDTKVWYAINTADGSLNWLQNANTGNSYMPVVDNAPVAANGELWVSKPDYTLSTLNMQTGTITWTEATADEFSARGPVAVGNRVYISSRSDTVYAWDALTRTPVWTRALQEGTGDVQHSQVNSALVYSSTGGGRLYRVAERGRVTCMDAAAGTVLWEYDAANATERVFWSTPIVEDDTVYVGGMDGRLYAIRGN